MKMKSLLKILVLVFWSHLAYCQFEITYDFSERKFSPINKKLKSDEDVRIEFLNYNPFIYSYSISTKTATYNSDVPNLLKVSTGDLLTFGEWVDKVFSTQSRVIDDGNAKTEDSQKKKNSAINLIWEIESSLLKFYRPNYSFKVTDRISEDKLLNLEKLIREIQKVDLQDKEALAFYDKLKSYYLFNAYFRREIFEKKLTIPKIDADQVEINFVVKPIRNEVTILGESLINNIFSNDSINFVLPIQRKNGYFSYSTGLFISNLSSPAYYAVADSIEAEEGSSNAFGYNALAHYLWDLEKLSIGFNLGLGVPIKKGKLSTVGLLGVSAGFGKRNRIIMNFGTSVGMIQAISKTNFKDFVKKPIKADLKEVSTYSKLKAGWMFTINFNINK
ncbi:MAG: hypothetical protein CFE22_06485 [Cytophagaceae bacterium BCCC1]|nr:MAG: hypothetical protein CFE22_06485 [Cytophagaceae bacterium BCCC1]